MTINLLKNIHDTCPAGRALLGLDVGKKTIGLALSNPTQTLATPLQTIKRTKFTQDMACLKAVIDDYDVGGFVIGLPINMDGSEGRRAQSIRDFALEMEKYLLQSSSLRKQGSYSGKDQIPGQAGDDVKGEIWIALWDERLSTVSADNIVDNLVDKRKTKINAKSSGLIDKLAAQTILQGALDFLDGHK